MSGYCVVEFNIESIDGDRFWQIVRWANRTGATEFYVWVLALNSFELYRQRADQLSKELADFNERTARRVVPDFCMWEVRDQAQLWDLTPASIEVLRGTELNRLFAFEEPSRYSGWGSENPPAYVTLHHLCLYREGIPMLAVFYEQYEELTLILKRVELEQFWGEFPDIMCCITADYYPDSFDCEPGGN